MKSVGERVVCFEEDLSILDLGIKSLKLMFGVNI